MPSPRKERLAAGRDRDYSRPTAIPASAGWLPGLLPTQAVNHRASNLSITTVRRLPSSQAPSPDSITHGGGSGLLKWTPITSPRAQTTLTHQDLPLLLKRSSNVFGIDDGCVAFYARTMIADVGDPAIDAFRRMQHRYGRLRRQLPYRLSTFACACSTATLQCRAGRSHPPRNRTPLRSACSDRTRRAGSAPPDGRRPRQLPCDEEPNAWFRLPGAGSLRPAQPPAQAADVDERRLQPCLQLQERRPHPLPVFLM